MSILSSVLKGSGFTYPRYCIAGSESGESKKCRARFGMAAQDQWCKPCLRKKKCQYVTGEEEERTSSHSANQRASDSESDLEDEPALNAQQLASIDRIKMEL